MKCPTKKKIYYSEKDALDALIQVRATYESNTALNTYKCMDCNNWHLTSKGMIHPKLHAALEDGTIDKIRLKSDWDNKF